VISRFARHLAAAGLALSMATPVAAQTDTVRTRSRLFTWKDVALLEAFAIATVAIAPLDRRMAERLQNPGVQENRLMSETAKFVESVTDPGAVLIGVSMYAYGRIAKKAKAADLGLHGTEALLIGAQVGNVLKGIVGRARPYNDVRQPHDYQLFRGFKDGNDYQSFPSGHTIAAFAAASAVTSETHRWWPRSVWLIGPIMYGGAATAGWSRMYHNKHWASDVITGAAIGTFAGQKVVQWHHTHPGNKIDRVFLGPLIARGAEQTTVVGVRLAR